MSTRRLVFEPGPSPNATLEQLIANFKAFSVSVRKIRGNKVGVTILDASVDLANRIATEAGWQRV